MATSSIPAVGVSQPIPGTPSVELKKLNAETIEPIQKTDTEKDTKTKENPRENVVMLSLHEKQEHQKSEPIIASYNKEGSVNVVTLESSDGTMIGQFPKTSESDYFPDSSKSEKTEV